jgi:beta-glucosidase
LDGELILDHTRSGELSWQNLAQAAEKQTTLIGGKAHDLRVEFTKNTPEPIARLKLMIARHYRPGEDQRLAHAAEIAAQSDLAIVFVGMPEFFETEGDDRSNLNLPGVQTELIRAVVKANPKTIVVLNAGAPVAMPWVDEVPAIVTMFYPGLEGGNAIADVLFGEVNPSGKVTVTYPKRLEDTPAFINYPGGREVLYGEGIFVGYRYYDVKDVEPLFPFGHGLSYTNFEYSNLKVTEQAKTGEPLQVSVTVRNSGKVAGKEVIQLYVHDKQSALPRPPKELKRFAKIALQPGESQTVSFTLDERALSFYDPYKKRWVVEPGEFEVLVGSSSRDIRARATCSVKDED